MTGLLSGREQFRQDRKSNICTEHHTRFEVRSARVQPIAPVAKTGRVSERDSFVLLSLLVPWTCPGIQEGAFLLSCLQCAQVPVEKLISSGCFLPWPERSTVCTR